MNLRWAEKAQCRGYGSEPYKSVVGMTKDEVEFVKAGGILLIDGCPPSGGGNGSGTTIRYVKTYKSVRGTRYAHRVPTEEMLTNLPPR